MLETHPFPAFVPPNARYLVLGSFAGKEAVRGTPDYDPAYDWYYGTRRNQFWQILEVVYGVPLDRLERKKALVTRLGMGIADIIYQCERQGSSNLDNALKNAVYNHAAIAPILDGNPIEKIFLTSLEVEHRFRSEFRQLLSRHPAVRLVYLPSPSPRNTTPLDEKIARYWELLPPMR